MRDQFTENTPVQTIEMGTSAIEEQKQPAVVQTETSQIEATS